MLRCIRSLVSLLAGAGGAASICGAQPTGALDELPEARRNARLAAAIRDAGYVCEDVVEASKAEASMPAWRVVCTDALVYLASSDKGDEALHVGPLPYTDPPNSDSVELPEQPPETPP